MAKHSNVGFVFQTYDMRYDGLNKYFKTEQSDKYHSDKHCPYIEGATVRMRESHQISHYADKCDHCTVDEPEFRKRRSELIR